MQDMKIKNLLREFDNDFKKTKLVGKMTNVTLFWEYKLKPATIDLDFNFTITFNQKAINAEYGIGDESFDSDSFVYEQIRPNFKDRTILSRAQKVAIPDFNVKYCTYNGESDLATINPKRNTKYKFGHTITIEAKDYNKEFDRKAVFKIMQDYVNKVEAVLYPKNKFYTVSK